MFRPGCKASFPPDPNKPRQKGIHIGAPACFALEAECRLLSEAFCDHPDQGRHGGIYVVGSVLQRPNWRDVDVRCILDDKTFGELFPDAGDHWEHDPRWLVLTLAISERLSKVTGLPIDFQFQPMTHANSRHRGRRDAVGMRFGSALATE